MSKNIQCLTAFDSACTLSSAPAQDYLKLSLAGAACNALVRFFLHPVDCVKTTVQAEMGREVPGDENGMEGGGSSSQGWIGTVKGILKKGGVGELTRGIDVSTVGGSFLAFVQKIYIQFFNICFEVCIGSSVALL